jgi:hypothetical protein
LEDCVHEQPARLRYFEALQVTLEADANLLFGSTDLPFTPSKLLALLAAGRPLVAIAPAGSAMVPRLAALGEPCVTFPAEGSTDDAVREVTMRLLGLRPNRPSLPANPALARYSAANVARRQLEILAAAR